MPCYRCGTRQTDPARGASPWKRGVRHGTMVLVCPDCQGDATWVSDMDRCMACGSTMLVRTLGETTCRVCGAVVPSGSDAPTDDGEGADESGRAPGLSDEVEAALARAFRRKPG